MIEPASGDLLRVEVEAVVNAVNTVGVMGKGLALAFKHAFPDNFRAYRQACAAGAVVPGKMFVFDRGAGAPRWIINFPTKRHWRDASRLDDVRAGLVDLVDQVRIHAIRSVALPALGCGLGGLAWADVEPMIRAAWAEVPDVRVLVFAPR